MAKRGTAPTMAQDARAAIPGGMPRREASPEIVYYEGVDQNSPEWFAVRCGLQTASMFSTVLSVKSGDDSIGRSRYMRQLAAERVMQAPSPEVYKNRAMERGKEMEPEAVQQYEADTLEDLRAVGFITREVGTGLDRFRVGCSPDRLVGEKGLLETKTERPDLFVERLERGVHLLPAEHRPQVHGQMWIADKEWVDLKIFWPKLPRFVVRFVRDDKYIREIEDACERFEFELVRLVERLRRMG